MVFREMCDLWIRFVRFNEHVPLHDAGWLEKIHVCTFQSESFSWNFSSKWCVFRVKNKRRRRENVHYLIKYNVRSLEIDERFLLSVLDRWFFWISGKSCHEACNCIGNIDNCNNFNLNNKIWTNELSVVSNGVRIASLSL